MAFLLILTVDGVPRAIFRVTHALLVCRKQEAVTEGFNEMWQIFPHIKSILFVLPTPCKDPSSLTQNSFRFVNSEKMDRVICGLSYATTQGLILALPQVPSQRYWRRGRKLDLMSSHQESICSTFEGGAWHHMPSSCMWRILLCIASS